MCKNGSRSKNDTTPPQAPAAVLGRGGCLVRGDDMKRRAHSMPESMFEFRVSIASPNMSKTMGQIEARCSSTGIPGSYLPTPKKKQIRTHLLKHYGGWCL